MKPHRFKFEARFVVLVHEEKKRCTIRKTRAREAKPGEPCILECWQGAAYRSKVERLGEAVLKTVLPIRIEAWEGRKEGVKIVLDGCELIGVEATNLAKDDGFQDLQDFADFFRSRLPFAGHFYEWHNP